MKLVKLLLAGPACVAGLRVGAGSHSEVHDYPWASAGGDSSRSGASRSSAPRKILSKATWTFKEEPKVGKTAQYPNFTSLVRATPLVDDKSNIYMSTVTSGTIRKISSEGKQLWAYEHKGRLPGTSTIMGGKLFAADVDGEVFSLDMETGTKRWSSKIANAIADDSWSVASGEGLIVVPALNEARLTVNSTRENNQVVAMDSSTGKVAWKFDLEEGNKIVNALISMRSGSCVFSDNNGTVYRIDLKTGKPIWRSRAKLDGAPTVGQAILDPEKNIVYSTWNELGWEINHVTLSGRVGAFDFETGKSLWVYVCQFPANGPPAVGTFAQKKRLLTLATGYPPDSPDLSMGVRDGHGREHQARLVFVEVDGARVGLTFAWYTIPSYYGAARGDDARPDACMPKGALSGPTVTADGTIFMGYNNGTLLSVHDENQDLWIASSDMHGFSMDAAFAASPVVAPGMLVVAPCNGLHVWKFDSLAPPESL